MPTFWNSETTKLLVIIIGLLLAVIFLLGLILGAIKEQTAWLKAEDEINEIGNQ